MLPRLRIAVVGSGIMGAAIARELAVRGADVLLVDQGLGPATGVTGRAFGWVNSVMGAPGTASHALWRVAVDEYGPLQSLMPAAFSAARKGSLIWKGAPAQTEEFHRSRAAAGEKVELLSRHDIKRIEPNLRSVPDCAVFSGVDLAIDPVRLASSLVQAAADAGAVVHFGESVTELQLRNGRLAGLRFGGRFVQADRVVVVAGNGITQLLDGIGANIGLTASAALLLRFQCSAPCIRHILRTPRIEVRQVEGSHTLVVAKSCTTEDDEGADDVGRRMLDVLRQEFVLPGPVTLLDVERAERPLFSDGLPRLGFLPQTEGVYIAAGHPGVILAPLLGRLAAEELLEGRRSDLIPAPVFMGASSAVTAP